MTKDVWPGDYQLPLSFNGWNYVLANPVRFLDPTGYVYVTFDDGPHPNDERILDILRANQARATFFFVGKNIDLNDPQKVEIVWRVAAEGHRLGNHTFEHSLIPPFAEFCLSEVAKSLTATENNIKAALLQVKIHEPGRYDSLTPATRNYIDNVITYGTGLFRAPGGSLTLAQDWQLGCWETASGFGGSFPVRGRCRYGIPGPYNIVRWTVDPRDFEIAQAGGSPYVIYDRIINGWAQSESIPGINIPIGDITRALFGATSWGSYGVRSNSDNILLHSWSDPTVLALEGILKWLKNSDYTFDLLEPAWPNVK